MEINDSKKILVDVAHQIYRSGLTPGKSGNISSKIFYNDDIKLKLNSKKSSSQDDFRVLITPSGVSLKDVTLKNVIMVDLEGNQLDGEGIPSSELYMHLEIYKKREDVKRHRAHSFTLCHRILIFK